MEIDNVELEKCYCLYEKEGYHLVSSSSVYVPMFQCILKCKCTEVHPMSELDVFFCKCIENGINTEKDIAFILALNYGIVEGEVEELIQNGIILKQEDILLFTEMGKLMYQQKNKMQTIMQEYIVNMNGITGEWSVELTEGIKESQILSNVIKLYPIKTAIKIDIENNEDVLRSLEKINNVHILSVSLLDYKTIYYIEKTILFFKNDNNQILFSLYDDKTQDLDIKLADTLLKKYKRRELFEIMQVESIIHRIEDNFIQNNRLLSNYDSLYKKSHTYYRNQEIRELFKSVFDIAEKKIFIVSPWIDNTNFVMTEELMSKIEFALKEKGIEISIGYGYISKEKMKKKRKQYASGNMYENPKEDKDWQTELMAQKLKERFRKYDNFKIFYVGTHEKVLSYDDRYTLVGSYNLLSYDGGESNKYKGVGYRFEGAVFIDDSEFAKHVQSEIISG